jgi:hypothetical protein
LASFQCCGTSLSRPPLPVGGHVEVARAHALLLIVLYGERSQQADAGLAVGEDADHPFAPIAFSCWWELSQWSGGFVYTRSR